MKNGKLRVQKSNFQIVKVTPDIAISLDITQREFDRIWKANEAAKKENKTLLVRLTMEGPPNPKDKSGRQYCTFEFENWTQDWADELCLHESTRAGHHIDQPSVCNDCGEEL